MSLNQDTYVQHQKISALVNPDFQEVKVYFDSLLQHHYTKLHQIRFTQPGFFEKFQIALGHNPTYCWTSADRDEFLQVWPNIEYAFQKSYENSLPISAADALVVLLERFTFEQIAAMDSWVLARVFQAYWKELCQLSFPDANTAEMNNTAGILQTA